MAETSQKISAPFLSLDVMIWADFDTRSDADVINTHEATRWRNKHKIPWGESGGSYRVMGGGTVVPQGSLQVTGEVSSRDVSNRIPRRLRLDLQCEIMEAPAPLVLGLITLQSTGLLTAILSQPGEAELPDLEDSDGVDDWGADIPEEVVMPKLKGTPAQKTELKKLCTDFSQLFGAPPKGGCKLKPLPEGQNL